MRYSTAEFIVASALFPLSLVHAEATVSILAVAKNGSPITPSSFLTVAPNDLITAEIYISGWGSPPFDGANGLLHAYQVTLAGEFGALSSGACPNAIVLMIIPRGWDAPLQTDSCPCDRPAFPVCDLHYGCVGPNHAPDQMATLGQSRSDFVFANFPILCELDVSSINIRWACEIDGADGETASKCQGGPLDGSSCQSNADCDTGICNAQFRHFVGTLYLKVGASACGTFHYTFDAGSTRLSAISSQDIVPTIQGLTLTVIVVCAPPAWGACCSGIDCSMVTCEEDCEATNQRFMGFGTTCSPAVCYDQPPPMVWPPHCTIDARRPFPPHQPENREGFTSQSWAFYNPPGESEDEPEDFIIRHVPPEMPPEDPIIGRVTISGPVVTLHFTNETNTAPLPISPNRWTCVKHIPSGVERCLGFLPADVNTDRTAHPQDILYLIDNLNGVSVPPLGNHQYDIDRSGRCSPADILTTIDLLNGVVGYPLQLGRSLEPCPPPIP